MDSNFLFSFLLLKSGKLSLYSFFFFFFFLFSVITFLVGGPLPTLSPSHPGGASLFLWFFFFGGGGGGGGVWGEGLAVLMLFYQLWIFKL